MSAWQRGEGRSAFPPSALPPSGHGGYSRPPCTPRPGDFPQDPASGRIRRPDPPGQPCGLDAPSAHATLDPRGMEDAMEDKPTDDSNAPRRASEKRKRGRSVSFRTDAAEYAELVAAAEARGQTLGTFIRSRVLAAPTTGARRRVSVELHAVGRLLAEVSRSRSVSARPAGRGSPAGGRRQASAARPPHVPAAGRSGAGAWRSPVEPLVVIALVVLARLLGGGFAVQNAADEVLQARVDLLFDPRSGALGDARQVGRNGVGVLRNRRAALHLGDDDIGIVLELVGSAHGSLLARAAKPRVQWSGWTDGHGLASSQGVRMANCDGTLRWNAQWPTATIVKTCLHFAHTRVKIE